MAAVEDGGAAHGAAMTKLKVFKAQAHAAKRAALNTAESEGKQSGERLKKQKELQALAEELQEKDAVLKKEV
eukprot:6191242-Pleurochrysis_carterae.AAC.2